MFGDRLGIFVRLRFDHDPDEGLGARLAQQHPTGGTESRRSRGDFALQHRIGVGAGLVDIGDIDQDLRQP